MSALNSFYLAVRRVERGSHEKVLFGLFFAVVSFHSVTGWTDRESCSILRRTFQLSSSCLELSYGARCKMSPLAYQ